MPADKIIETQDGSHSILSHQYGVSYHSKYGAITESKHVFIEAGLYPQIIQNERAKVLEIGFGTGLNAFLTYLEAEKRKAAIYYEGIEAFPLSADQYEQLNYPELLDVPELKEKFLSLHRCSWGEPVQLSEHFSFQKRKMRTEDLEIQDAFDVIYFDAFAPSAQPELWEKEVLEKMFKALRKGGFLVTYCAKGVVKRRLKDIGFEVESLPGPPGKREMTRGARPS